MYIIDRKVIENVWYKKIKDKQSYLRCNLVSSYPYITQRNCNMIKSKVPLSLYHKGSKCLNYFFHILVLTT